eukprot:Platyproteum_vivax@DN6389_c0_g1_i3.p1
MRGPLLSCTTNEADKDLALQNAILRNQMLEQQLADMTNALCEANQEIGALKARSDYKNAEVDALKAQLDCKTAEVDDVEFAPQWNPRMKIGHKWHSCVNFSNHALTKADLDRIKNTMVTYKFWQTRLSFNNTNADADCAKVIAEIMNLHPQGFEALTLTNQFCLRNEALRAFLDNLNPNSLKRLKTIDLSGCAIEHNTGGMLVAELIDQCGPELKTLILAGLTGVSSWNAYCGLLKGCGQYVKEIIIGGNYNEVATVATLDNPDGTSQKRVISIYLTSHFALSNLLVDSAIETGDTSLADLDLVELCKSQLKTLDHRGNINATEVHTKAFFGLLNRYGNQLEKLSIFGSLTHMEFVDGLTTNFQNLRQICFKGTSEKAIQKLLERCGHLEELEITDVPGCGYTKENVIALMAPFKNADSKLTIDKIIYGNSQPSNFMTWPQPV